MSTSNKGIPMTEYVYSIIITILAMIVIFSMIGCEKKNTKIKQLQHAYDMYHEIAADRLTEITELKVDVASLTKEVELKDKHNALIVLTGERDKEIHRVELMKKDAISKHEQVALKAKVKALIERNNAFLEEVKE